MHRAKMCKPLMARCASQLVEISRLAEDETWLRTRRGPVQQLCKICADLESPNNALEKSVWDRTCVAADFVLVETWEDEQDAQNWFSPEDEGSSELFSRSAAR